MSSNSQIPRKPTIPFADVCEVVNIEAVPNDQLQDFEREQNIKNALVLKVSSPQRLSGKTYAETLFFQAKAADIPGLKVGDTVLVKARVKEGSRYLSYPTFQVLKK